VAEDEYNLGSWLGTLEDHCVTPQDWLFLHILHMNAKQKVPSIPTMTTFFPVYLFIIL